MGREAGERKRRLSTPIKLLILFLAILMVFGVINLVWFLGHKHRYNGFAEEMEYWVDEADDSRSRYSVTIGDYRCIMKMPHYLSFGGFMAVEDSEGYVTTIDENGNEHGNGLSIALYIWPKMFAGYDIGLFFYDKEHEIFEQVYIDPDCNLVDAEEFDDEFVAYINTLIADNKDEIDCLFDIADQCWHIEF